MKAWWIGVISCVATKALFAGEMNPEGLVLIDSFSGRNDRAFSLEERIDWKKDLKTAFEEAKESKKGLFVVVLGNKNCPWSEKLTQEILCQKPFLDPLEEKVVFYRAELSELQKIDAGFVKVHNIKEVPTILLFSSEGKEITRIGYLPFQPAAFAKRLLSVLQGFTELQKGLQVANKEVPDQDLEKMYLKAKELGCSLLKQDILELGSERKKNLFFMVERYAQLLAEGKKKESETKSLRSSIQSLDPKNQKGVFRQLAILEFEEAIRTKKHPNSPFAVIKPLMEYLRVYGLSDPENVWRIEMMIAQYLFSKNQILPALHHAEAAYSSAPDSIKEEIRESLEYLRDKCKEK